MNNTRNLKQIWQINDLLMDYRRDQEVVFLRQICFSSNLVLAEQTAWKFLVDDSKWGTFKSQKIPLPLMICYSLKMRKVIYSDKSNSQKLLLLHRSGILI